VGTRRGGLRRSDQPTVYPKCRYFVRAAKFRLARQAVLATVPLARFTVRTAVSVAPVSRRSAFQALLAGEEEEDLWPGLHVHGTGDDRSRLGTDVGISHPHLVAGPIGNVGHGPISATNLPSCDRSPVEPSVNSQTVPLASTIVTRGGRGAHFGAWSHS
jgi:hypothetical protein